MSTEEKLMQRVINLIEKRGQSSVKKSSTLAKLDITTYEPLNGAIKYFVDEFWFDFLHPALISLACESVGGRPEITVDIGAAFVLLAGAADIHDDIIDESTSKGPQLTVYGKYGRDIAVLSGDLLLMKGLYVLNEGLGSISQDKRQMILDSINQAFLEMCGGESKETSWRRRMNISREDYLEIIKQKVAASEAATRIGAILGCGTESEIELLSHYGRTFGILMTLRNEFIDVFEADELGNRLKKECLPLPILIAFQDDSRKKEILQLLQNKLTEKSIERILDLTLDFGETQKLVNDMKNWIENENSLISPLKHCKKELEFWLLATTEDI